LAAGFATFSAVFVTAAFAVAGVGTDFAGVFAVDFAGVLAVDFAGAFSAEAVLAAGALRASVFFTPASAGISLSVDFVPPEFDFVVALAIVRP
jgi:hypothetical protein